MVKGTDHYTGDIFSNYVITILKDILTFLIFDSLSDSFQLKNDFPYILGFT